MDDQELVDQYNAGRDLTELAEQLGIAPTSVRVTAQRAAKRLGVELNRPRTRTLYSGLSGMPINANLQKTVEEIAKKMAPTMMSDLAKRLTETGVIDAAATSRRIMAHLIETGAIDPAAMSRRITSHLTEEEFTEPDADDLDVLERLSELEKRNAALEAKVEKLTEAVKLLAAKAKPATSETCRRVGCRTS